MVYDSLSRSSTIDQISYSDFFLEFKVKKSFSHFVLSREKWVENDKNTNESSKRSNLEFFVKDLNIRVHTG